MIDTVVRESWSKILDRLRQEIGERFFAMWFERSSLLELKRGTLAIGVPNLFIREWVEEHYGPVLGRIAGEELGTSVRITVKVDPGLFREMRERTERMEEVVDTRPETADGKTLEGFLVTAGNRMAVQALKHVADSARPPMNPLVIFGPEGTGKSHLAAAAARLWPAGTRSYRVTGEEFARRFSWNLKTRRIDAFRGQVVDARVLILDDAQDLAGKSATQREVAALVQEQKARGGQCIAFADRHPKEIAELDPGLESVLLSGMLVPLEPPGRADTIRILERCLKTARRRIPAEVIELVVDKVGGPANRLDRLVRKIYAFAGLTGEPVDAGFLDRHLAEIAGPRDPAERRMDLILGMVEEHFDVERKDLLAKRKTKILALPRGVVVFLLREQGGLTFKEIGRQLGERSHTSVYLMFQKYAETIQADPVLSRLVRETGRRLVTAGT